MGEKRPSVRTLSDGYKVQHLPPSDEHPEGKMILLPGQSRLRQRLLDGHVEHHQAHQELRQRHEDRINQRREKMARNGVPPEKRSC